LATRGNQAAGLKQDPAGWPSTCSPARPARSGNRTGCPHLRPVRRSSLPGLLRDPPGCSRSAGRTRWRP